MVAVARLQLPLGAVLRLWDTYFALLSDAKQSGASIDALLDFHMYACLAVLEPLQEDICRKYKFKPNVHVCTNLMQACIFNRKLPRALEVLDNMV